MGKKEYEELINISPKKRKNLAKTIRTSIPLFWILLAIGAVLLITLGERSIWFTVFSIIIIFVAICFGFYVGYIMAEVKNAFIERKSFLEIIWNDGDFMKIYPNYMNYLDGTLTEKQLKSQVHKLNYSW